MNTTDNIEQLIDSRSLSLQQATLIANSQNDIETIQENKMIRALSHHNANFYDNQKQFIDARLRAFNSLDPLSQLIVVTILETEDLEEAANDLRYYITCLSNATQAIENL